MLGTLENPGIMSLIIEDLFKKVVEMKSEGVKYNIILSYFEIYNETIRDLFNDKNVIIELREDYDKGLNVTGLLEIETETCDQVMKLLMYGNKRRTQEPTGANKCSSRSHAILQVKIEKLDSTTKSQ